VTTKGENRLPKTDRRSFLAKSAAAAAATATGGAVTAAAAPKAPAKRVFWPDGKVPEKQQMFPPAVAYGNLLFVSGVGAHVPSRDIKEHTKIVLDEIQKRLEAAGSSMDKVLKAQVYLADINDYAAMNEVYKGRFGAEPPVRTTTAAAMVPGKSLVEIDVIAYI
jgi:enamine deaminase RidA (YjgF/YER057c/UK114 family)